jgi:hypothetical protein
VGAIFQIIKANPNWSEKQVVDEVNSQMSQGILNLDIAGTGINHTREKDVGIAGDGDSGAMEVTDMDVPLDFLSPYSMSEVHQVDSTFDPNVRGSQEIHDHVSNQFLMQYQRPLPLTSPFENGSDDVYQTQTVHRSTGAFPSVGNPNNPRCTRKVGPHHPPHVAQSSVLGLPRAPELVPDDVHVVLLVNTTNSQ